MAQRSRAAAACLPCKASKTRCNDYRPCARCKKAGIIQLCMDPQVQQKAASSYMVRLSSTLFIIGCAFDGSSTLPFSNASYLYQPAPTALTCASPFPAQLDRCDAHGYGARTILGAKQNRRSVAQARAGAGIECANCDGVPRAAPSVCR